jgi:hypothetical protein
VVPHGIDRDLSIDEPPGQAAMITRGSRDRSPERGDMSIDKAPTTTVAERELPSTMRHIGKASDMC